MSRYELKQSFKTRALNAVRRMFATPRMEKMLIGKIENSPPHTVWRKVIPPNYLYPKNSIREVTRENVNYKLDISNVVEHFIYFGYKDKMFEPVMSDIKAAKVILDIGANIGSTAMYFSKVNNSAKIFAFEPHPHTFKRASENLNRNQFRNINLVNLGLGNKKETLQLFEVNEKNPGMNRILQGNESFPHVTIEVDTLDNFSRANEVTTIGFIKIDVEGFEYNVIEGGTETLKKDLPTLFIELDDSNLRENGRSAKELMQLLKTIGYGSVSRSDTGANVTAADDFVNCHYDIVVRR
jgi:FkbM family methyltransferase